MQPFACLLRKARVERGLSQDHLARMVGVSQQAVSAYECGKPCPPDIVVAFAQVLGEENLLRYYCESCHIRQAQVGVA